MTSARLKPVAAATFVIDDCEPAVPVAFPLGTDAPTFGLERPTRLVGAAALSPDALPSATGLDHVPGLRSILAEACRRQALAGRDWLGLPPIVLVADLGFGRGLVARRIADLAGVPLVEAGGANLDVAAARDGIGLGDVPAPVLAMALTRCANPIVLLDITETNPTPIAARRLTEMLDPTRAGRWLHERLRTVFDLSNVSWIVQAHRRSPTVAAIEDVGGEVIHLSAHNDVREDLRRLSAAQTACRNGSEVSVPRLVGEVHAELQRRFGRETPPGKALWDHAVASRDELAARR